MLRDQWNTGDRRPETLELEEAAGAEEQKTLHKDTDGEDEMFWRNT